MCELLPVPLQVTGQHADEEEIDKMIETGESETIFQKAILEQGRGYVSHMERIQIIMCMRWGVRWPARPEHAPW